MGDALARIKDILLTLCTWCATDRASLLWHDDDVTTAAACETWLSSSQEAAQSHRTGATPLSLSLRERTRSNQIPTPPTHWSSDDLPFLH